MKRVLPIQVLLLLMLLSMQALPQAISLTYPNGGEVLQAATLVDIEWNYINVDNILIEYSLDGGFHWHTIISSIPSSALKYTWKVPPTPSDSCLVRITDILGGAQDESDAYFTIPVPTIRMVYPNEPGTVLFTGTIEGLEWETPDVDDVKLEYSLDNGNTWQNIASKVDGFWRYYNWTVPNTTTSQGLMRVTSNFNNKIFHITEHNFSIIPLPVSTPAKYRGGKYDGFAKRSNLDDFITLTHPAGGEVWTTNSTRRITWDFENVEDISIDISYDDGATWNNLISSYPASAKGYNWVVAGQTSTECKIRVRDIRTGVEDISPEVFTIPPPLLTITYPRDGDVLMAQTIESIEWIGDDITNVSIHYSLNGGETWLSITNSVPGIWNYFNWVVPNVETENVLIKITDIDNASNVDILTTGFSIAPLTFSSPAKYRGGKYDGYSTRNTIRDSLQLLSPNGGEVFLSSQSYPIQWAYNNVDNLKIDFSYDNGNTWTEVIASVPASALQYNWTVPSQPSQYCKIRITCLDNPEIYDISDLVFTIPHPPVSLIYPYAGVKLKAGTIESIEWESPGSESVKIEFSGDKGETWQAIAATVNGHWGYYNWTVPSTLSDQCLIRITDNQNAAYQSTTPNVFSIIPLEAGTAAKFRGGSYDGYATSIFLDIHLMVRRPNGWEAYLTNEPIPIRWTHLNIEGKMRIQVTQDNEQTWQTIVTGIPVEQRYYLWEGMRQESRWNKIRVVHESGLWEDKSDNFFIVGRMGGLYTSALASTSFCAGQSIAIPFTTNETYGPENMFIAQLSDEFGQFMENSDSLGVLVGTAAGVIHTTIPEHVKGGSGYRIRIVSTDPPIIGVDNGTNLIINALPDINLGDDTILCEGNSLILDAGYAESNTYLWSTGVANTHTIEVTTGGIYYVNVYNACGLATDTVKVIFRELPGNNLPDQVTLCHNSSVALNASHPEAVTYLWNTGQVTPSIVVNTPGNYTVTMANACGQVQYTTDVVGVDNPVVDLGDDFALCGEEIRTLSAPPGFISYLWNNGSTQSSIDISTNGFYNVSVTDQNGCSATSRSVRASKFPAPVVNIQNNGDQTICPGQAAELEAVGSFAAYQWYKDGVLLPGKTEHKFDVSEPGSYHLVATDITGCQGISNSIHIDNSSEVFLYLYPKDSDTYCSYDGFTEINLTASPGFKNYELFYSNGSRVNVHSGGPDFRFFEYIPGTYSYYTVATDENGCIGKSDLVNITILGQYVSINSRGSTNICSGDSVELYATGYINNLLWLRNGSPISGQNDHFYYVKEPGSYFVIVNDGYCEYASNSINITTSEIKEVSIRNNGNDTLCYGETTVLEVDGEYTSYLWSTGETTSAIEVDDAGEYWVSVNDKNCVSTAFYELTMHPISQLTVPGDISITKGENVTLTATYSNGTLMWSHGIENGVVFTPETSDIYTATLTSLYGCGTLIENVTITVLDPALNDYTLTVNVKGNGFVTINDNTYTSPITVNEGTILDLDVEIQTGWPFVDWTGDLVSANPSESVVMFSDKNITARFGRLGDVNLDGSINIIDVTMLVSYILEQNPPGFYVLLADVNQDSFINIIDVVADVNIILYDAIYPPGKSFPASRPAWISFDNGLISLESDGTLAALQFEFYLEIDHKTDLQMLQNGLHLAFTQHGDRIKGVIFSLNNQLIPEGRVDLIKTNAEGNFKTWGKNVASNAMATMVEVEPVSITYIDESISDGFVTRVYPNPSKGLFNLQLEGPQNLNLEIKIYDANGRLVGQSEYFMAEAGKFITELHYENLSPGFYIMQVKGNNPVSDNLLFTKLIKLMLE